MKLDVHIDSLEDGLSKVESKPKVNQNKQIVQGKDKKPNGNYAKKPETTKSEQDGTFLDLNVIGRAVSKFLLDTTKHKIKPEQIKILYLDGAGDAISFCQAQYDFYEKKNRPDLTPLYLYTGRDGKVMKVPMNKDTGMFNLGTAGQFVDVLNQDGYNFMAAIDLVVQ